MSLRARAPAISKPTRTRRPVIVLVSCIRPQLASTILKQPQTLLVYPTARSSLAARSSSRRTMRAWRVDSALTRPRVPPGSAGNHEWRRARRHLNGGAARWLSPLQPPRPSEPPNGFITPRKTSPTARRGQRAGLRERARCGGTLPVTVPKSQGFSAPRRALSCPARDYPPVQPG